MTTEQDVPEKPRYLLDIPAYTEALLAVATAAQLYVHRGPRSPGRWERLFGAVEALDEIEMEP